MTSSLRSCLHVRITTRWDATTRRIRDAVVFDKLIEALVSGMGYERIADRTCSATTIRRRRDEWIALGLAEQLRVITLTAYDQMIGLDLDQLVAHVGAVVRELAGRASVRVFFALGVRISRHMALRARCRWWRRDRCWAWMTSRCDAVAPMPLS